MPFDLAALGIDRMTVDEKLELINAIWATFPEPHPLTAEQRAELDRRIDEMDRGVGQSIPAEEVFARLYEKFGSDPNAT